MAHSLQFSLSISSAFSRRPSKEVGPKPYSYAQAVRPISAVHSAIVSPPSKTSISNEETLAIAPSPVPQHLPAVIELDKVTEAELKEDGARSSRRTKLVCTIGPVTCGFAELEALAAGGMNVARINMCHGTREWHRGVVERVRRLNEERGYAVAIMMDTEGSELRMGDLAGATSAKAQDDRS